jgi:outer membrane receptor protein involved in Fe transport
MALSLCSVSAAALMVSGGQAWAQSAAPEPEAVSVEEVVVTASRVRQDGFSAPTPTTVVGGDFIDSAVETSIADVVNTLPSFAPNRTPTTNTLNAVSAGANFLDLRGLGPNRTLLLVDGRRVPPTTDTNLVDANLIPSSLVERVEVVTGGASAAWGSDAVAGVVNFILVPNLEGWRGQVQLGQSSRRDAQEYKVSLAYGRELWGGRGRLLVGAEVFANEGVMDQSSREWARGDWQLIANPAYAPGNGQPQRIISPNVRLSTATEGGLISSGPLRGTQFGLGGAPTAFTFGTASSIFQIGGDGINLGRDITIYQPNDRQSYFVRLNYDLTEDIEAFAEASYSRSFSDNPVLPAWDFGSTRIFNDNAYLPDSVRTAMATNGITSFLMGRIHSDFGWISAKTVAETNRFSVGAKGSFAPGWTWDGYYEYGRTHNGTDLYNNPIVANLALARDAVVNPANGQIVCRSTLTTPGNGCVPINLFGPNAAAGSPALGYILGSAQVDYKLIQQVAAFNVQASPFELWAGPVALAAGIEFRREEVSSEVDALSLTNAFLTGNFKPIRGARDIREAYVEAVVPLVADAPFAKLIDLNLAARLTDYSTSGSVTTWKAGISYAINDDLRFRTTWSRDIRAPNLNELFNPASMTFATVFDPVKATTVTISQIQRGNTALVPEEGDTWTAGVIYQPSWFEGFRVSVDYFDIELTGAISLLGIQDTINRCYSGNTSLCGFLNRDAGDNLVSIVRTNYNLASRSTRGFDVEVGYEFPLSRISETLPGQLSARILGTHIDELVFNDGTTSIDRAGDLGTGLGGSPEWRWTANLGYRNGAFSAAAQTRYLSGGVYDSTWGPLDINDNTLDSATYVDLSASYDLIAGDRTLTLFGSVDNVFDEPAPIVGSSFFAPVASNPALYDVLGRYFSAGLRFKY